MIFTVYYISGKNGEIFYVGVTSGDIKLRLCSHKTEGKGYANVNPEKDAKIRKHWKSLEVHELEHIEGEESDAIALENYWISQLKAWGFPLTNKIGLQGRRKKIASSGVRKKAICINEIIHEAVLDIAKKTGRFPYGYIEIAIREKLERDGVSIARKLKAA